MKRTLMFISLVLMSSAVLSVAQADNRQFLKDLLQQDRQRPLLDKNALQPPALSQADSDYVAQLKAQQQQRMADKQKSPPKALMFVSFSMPRNELVRRVQDATRWGIPVVIRGMVNGDMRQTANAVAQLIKASGQGGVQIDPTAFRQYHVDAVPTLLVNCEGKHDRLYGDIALTSALEKVAESGDCAPQVKQWLLKGVAP